MAEYKKDNRWYIDYYLPNGKRKREVVKIKGVDPKHITRQDALKALSIRRAEIAQGKFNIADTQKRVPFEKLMSEYLVWAEGNHKWYDRDIEASKPLLSYFRGKPINNFSAWHVEGYKASRKSQGLMPATINKELGILKRMFNLLLDGTFKDIKLSSNPIGKVKLLKTSNPVPRVYKTSEFKALYDAAPHRFKPILLCAYMTGMRRGEIVKLKWEHIDFEGGYIFVNETKNNESRSIPIGGGLLDTLNRLRQNSESEYVFTTSEGTPYTSKSVWAKAWKTALGGSGIPYGRFHDIRHTFISTLIVDEKEDNATVMAISGHKDLRMLQRYSHTREEAKKSAISKLGNRLKSAAMDTYSDTSETNQETVTTNISAISPSN